jgi:hypothetical protein
MDDRKLASAVTDLGFHSAEMRTLAGRLAEACAREDLDTVFDTGQALMRYARDYPGLLVRVLAHKGLTPPDWYAAGARSESSNV